MADNLNTDFAAEEEKLKSEFQSMASGLLDLHRQVTENFTESMFESYKENFMDTMEELTSEKFPNEFLAEFQSIIDGLNVAYATFGNNVELLNSKLELSKKMMEQTGLEDKIDSVLGKVKAFPGGGILSSMLRLDDFGKELKQKLMESMVKSMVTVNGKLVLDSKLAAGHMAENFKESFGKIGGFIQHALTDPLMKSIIFAGVFVLIATAVYKFLEKQEEASEEMIKNNGLIASQYEAKLKPSMDATQKSLVGMNANAKDVAQSTSALVKEFGTVNMASEELVTNATKVTLALGISAENSAKLFKSFNQIADLNPAESATQIEAMTRGAVALGEPANAITEDLVKNADKMVMYFGKYGKNVTSALINIHKMSLEIKDVVNITDKLLDFEQNISDEIETSVMLGRDFNLTTARGLALQGKTAEAAEEVMKQVGGEASYREMNMYQQRQMLKTIGMTSEELEKHFALEKAKGELGSEQKSQLADIEKQLKANQKLTGKSLLDQKQQELSVSQLKDAFGSLMKTLTPILITLSNGMQWVISGIASVMHFLQGMGPLLNIIAGTLLVIFGTMVLIKGIRLFAGMISSVKQFSTALKGGVGSLKEFFAAKKAVETSANAPTGTGGSGGVANTMKSFSAIDWKQMMGIAVIMLAFAASIWILSKALQNIAGVPAGAIAALVIIMIVFTGAIFVLAKVAEVSAVGLGILAIAMLAFGLAILMMTPALIALTAMMTVLSLEKAAALVVMGVGFLALAGGLAAFSLVMMSIGLFGLVGFVLLGFAMNKFLNSFDPARITSLNIFTSSLVQLRDVLTSFPKDLNLDNVVKPIERISDATAKARGGFLSNLAESIGITANLKSNKTSGNNLDDKFDKLIDAIKGLEITLDGERVGHLIAKKQPIKGRG